MNYLWSFDPYDPYPAGAETIEEALTAAQAQANLGDRYVYVYKAMPCEPWVFNLSDYFEGDHFNPENQNSPMEQTWLAHWDMKPDDPRLRKLEETFAIETKAFMLEHNLEDYYYAGDLVNKYELTPPTKQEKQT